MNYSEEQKQQIYKNFIERGRPFYHIDKSKEPTEEERKIILEMGKRENLKVKRDIELEKSAAVSKPVNEIKAFHRLINNALSKY